MDPRLSAYGSVAAMFGGKPTPFQFAPNAMNKVHRRPTLPVLVGCLFVPWVLFAATFWLRSFELRKDSEAFANVLSCCLLFPVLTFAWMTFNLRGTGGDLKPMFFLTATSLLAWILAFVLGNWNYMSFMRPYYDINNLNAYPNVDPSTFVGAQLMDAGRIQFTAGSKLLTNMSMGFKNEQVYCVAPIASGTYSNQSTYDFWAIGLNCCSGHKPDYHCGEYNNPTTRWGLRLMDESQRDMFRLAVKQAEAAFNLKAPNPVLMYWLSDPTLEMNAYQDDGHNYFFKFMFGYLALHLFLSLLLLIVLYTTR